MIRLLPVHGGRRAGAAPLVRRPTPSLARVALLVVTFWILLALPRAEAAQLPYGAALGRAYDAVLDARFEAVEPALHEACGPAPVETCELVRATALWWRIQLDPQNRTLDAAFRGRIDAVIDAMTRWTERQPRRADAWFFLGAAYGVRVQYRVLRAERLSAARDGKRIKDALERALSIDSNLQDAYFGIGLYHYYADLAPAALKLVRWMLFLPGGNRAQGLREMLQARDGGDLLRGETDYQIHLVYLWYERKTEAALALLGELHARYPHNPLFLQAAAEAQVEYRHDHAASLATWRSMFNLARQGRLALPQMSEARARVGIAEALDALFETDYAIEQLRIVVDTKPAAPYGLAARAALRLAQCEDRMGRRPEAMAAYRTAAALAPGDDPQRVRAAAREGLRRAVAPRTAEAYRLSIEGWRALQRNDVAHAEQALTRAQALAPADPVTRYRVGKLLVARRHREAALEAFEQVVATRPVPAPTVLAAAYLEAGRLCEQAGDRVRALDRYLRAAGVAGAEEQTHRAATQALTRLHSRTPAR